MQTFVARICKAFLAYFGAGYALRGRMAYSGNLSLPGSSVRRQDTVQSPDNQRPATTHEIASGECVLPLLGVDEGTIEEVFVLVLRRRPGDSGQFEIEETHSIRLVSGEV